MNALFLFNSTMLGVGLAMDAFSVSVVNGMNETSMSKSKATGIAGVYSFFQALMTLLGWICTHTVVILFESIQSWIPWISLFLLTMIGLNMIREGRSSTGTECPVKCLSPHMLLLQGFATSIDALSVGLTIADYKFTMALICALIIGGVTLIICSAGVELGKKVGIRMAERATVLGGIILILIGIEIWFTGIH